MGVCVLVNSAPLRMAVLCNAEPDIMTITPFTHAPMTSASCVVFAFFALSASGIVGERDVPLLVLVGLVALAALAAVAAKRWHVVGVTPTGAARQRDASDARDLIRMDRDKG